jgi:hypothetical protein
MALRIPLKAGDIIDRLRDFSVSRLASVQYFIGLLCKSEVLFKYLEGSRSTRSGYGSLPTRHGGNDVQVCTMGLPSCIPCVICYSAHMPLLNIGDPTGCLC